jgi:hypothetical protein
MKGWSVRFKDRKPDPAEMTYLAREYSRDLADERVTESEFKRAERIVVKRCRFYPVMADILDAVKEVREQDREQRRIEQQEAQRKQLAAPELTEEEIQENLRRIREIIATAGR